MLSVLLATLIAYVWVLLIATIIVCIALPFVLRWAFLALKKYLAEDDEQYPVH